MGICTSCDATAPVATAKVVLNDGRLHEYSYPVRVSHALQRATDEANYYFLCNSDDMEFDDVVSAVEDDEELQPGQVYFALPMGLLNKPLLPEEMAALAVKASAAMMKGGGGGESVRRRREVVFVEKSVRLAERKAVAERRKGRRSGAARRSRTEFSAKLSAIVE